MLDRLNGEEIQRITEYFDLSQGKERPLALWIIGRPAAGKTTTASLIRDALRQAGHRVDLVDGETVREIFDGALGYSKDDRLVALKRLIKINRFLQTRCIIPITATIAGFRHFREIARREVDNIRFVFLDCPFDVAAQRDKKGIYAKALAGEIKDFYGVDFTFESPTRYELKLDSAALKPAQVVTRILGHFERGGFFS